MSNSKFNSIAEIIEDIKNGKMVILVDDESRENEGDLILAADHITPESVNFMATHAKGLICLSLTESQIQNLGLPLMVKEEENQCANKTAFTLSIEAAKGVTTGISAADRAQTIRVAANPQATPADISVPGHIFPIRAHKGGVLKRAGHTESSVDLAVLAGLNPAAVICEIMNEDGTMARVPQLLEFAEKHNIKIGTIEDLIEYRLENDTFVEEVAVSDFQTKLGTGFKVHLFRNKLDGLEHLAFSKGELNAQQTTVVRVQSQCLLGDIFAGELSLSSQVIEDAFRYIDQVGAGVFVYLRMEDVDTRFKRRVEAYQQLSQGQDREEIVKVFKSDKKDYGIGAQILRSLGVRKLNLISNYPSKRVGIKGYGLEIVDSISFAEVRSQLELKRKSQNESEKRVLQ